MEFLKGNNLKTTDYFTDTLYLAFHLNNHVIKKSRDDSVQGVFFRVNESLIWVIGFLGAPQILSGTKIAHFAIFWQKYPMGLLPINGWFWLVGQSKMVKWVKMFPLAYFRQFTYFLLLCTKTMAYTRWRHRDVIRHSSSCNFLSCNKNFTTCKNKKFKFRCIPVQTGSNHGRSCPIWELSVQIFGPEISGPDVGPSMFFKVPVFRLPHSFHEWPPVGGAISS